MNTLRYGRLTVAEETEPTKYVSKRGATAPSRNWRCICDCGNVVIAARSNVLRGATKSCGCYKKEVDGLANRTHGKSKTATYYVWCAMKRRCYNKNSHDYAWYGARGIEMCQAWRESFEAFERDMGTRPSDKHSIERLDNNANYSPDNCEWKTMKEQQNNRRGCRQIEHQGRTQTVKQWAHELGYNYSSLLRYVGKLGLTMGEAILREPSRNINPNRR